MRITLQQPESRIHLVHGSLTLALVIGAILTLAAADELPSQEPSTHGDISALSAVMVQRVVWMADATPFDACQVYQALGRPADFPHQLPLRARQLLDHDGEPCTGPPSTRPIVELHAIGVDGPRAQVVLRVTRQGYTYLETHDLRTQAERGPWRVIEVRLHGWLHFTPADP
jgi:hypothetical protein